MSEDKITNDDDDDDYSNELEYDEDKEESETNDVMKMKAVMIDAISSSKERMDRVFFDKTDFYPYTSHMFMEICNEIKAKYDVQFLWKSMQTCWRRLIVDWCIAEFEPSRKRGTFTCKHDMDCLVSKAGAKEKLKTDYQRKIGQRDSPRDVILTFLEAHPNAFMRLLSLSQVYSNDRRFDFITDVFNVMYEENKSEYITTTSLRGAWSRMHTTFKKGRVFFERDRFFVLYKKYAPKHIPDSLIESNQSDDDDQEIIPDNAVKIMGDYEYKLVELEMKMNLKREKLLHKTIRSLSDNAPANTVLIDKLKHLLESNFRKVAQKTK
jgi:hypothetical protein